MAHQPRAHVLDAVSVRRWAECVGGATALRLHARRPPTFIDWGVLGKSAQPNPEILAALQPTTAPRARLLTAARQVSAGSGLKCADSWERETNGTKVHGAESSWQVPGAKFSKGALRAKSSDGAGARPKLH